MNQGTGAENWTNRTEPPAYFTVEPGKTGAFQPEPPGKFPVEPSKTGTGRNRALQTKSPGNFPVEPKKPPDFRAPWVRLNGDGHPADWN